MFSAQQAHGTLRCASTGTRTGRPPVRLADEALYRAKQAGRNRDDYLGGKTDATTTEAPMSRSSRASPRANPTTAAARAAGHAHGASAEASGDADAPPA